MSRDIRRFNNSTEGSQSFSTGAPSSSLQEGGTFVSIENGNLAVYRKHKGIEFKNYMTRQGNQVIDRKLTTSELEYTKKFIDYRYFKHNMTDDIGTSEVFLPWQGTGEQSDMNNATTAFLVPFKMSLEKIMFRCETLSSTTANIRFKIYKQDNDTTSDELALATYEDDIASSTTFTLKKTDFSALPVVDTGMKCGISITANADPSGDTDWWITSVWRVEVTI